MFTRILGIALLVVSALIADTAGAQLYLDEIYSNGDGSEQFIVIDYWGAPSQLMGRGISLLSGNMRQRQSYSFPGNLTGPDGAPQNGRFIVATQAFADRHSFKPDFIMPAGTLFVSAGFVETGNSGEYYTALPTDGLSALYTTIDYDIGSYDNAPAVALAVNHAGEVLPLAPIARAQNIEYYNASLDDYLLTDYADEIAALDAGVISGWQRTGYHLDTWTGPPADGSLIPGIGGACRIYLGTSHFFSLGLFPGNPVYDCVEALKAPGAVEEAWNAFYATLPDSGTGACPANQIPVFRFWNPRGTSHRLTSQSSVRGEMLARGWISEGDGTAGVVMCVPGPE